MRFLLLFNLYEFVYIFTREANEKFAENKFIYDAVWCFVAVVILKAISFFFLLPFFAFFIYECFSTRMIHGYWSTQTSAFGEWNL